MARVRRSERIGAIVNILCNNPNQTIAFNHFTEMFKASKSTISEDIAIIKELFDKYEFGEVETVVGAAGGVRCIARSFKKDIGFIEDICGKLAVADRILPGGILYMTDILFTPKIVQEFGKMLAAQFRHTQPDFVVTVETKGVPIALMTARALDCPVVLARRESKVTEGSTLSINYVSASSKRIQTMSMVKRSVQRGQRGLIIDDFMKGGGTVGGLIDLLHEFEAEVVGVGVIMSTKDPKEKKVKDYRSLMELDLGDENEPKVIVKPSMWLKEG
ncbi:MAG: pur operon repressor [Clostridiales bacterium]|nr:pur operon repressor [Clostridiales bacterium]